MPVWHLAHKLVRVGYLGSLNDLVLVAGSPLAAAMLSCTVPLNSVGSCSAIPIVEQPHLVEIADIEAVKVMNSFSGSSTSTPTRSYRRLRWQRTLHKGQKRSMSTPVDLPLPLCPMAGSLAGRSDEVEAAEHRRPRCG